MEKAFNFPNRKKTLDCGENSARKGLRMLLALPLLLSAFGVYAQDLQLGSLQFQRFHNPWIYNLDTSSQNTIQMEGSQKGYAMLQEGKWYLDFALNATESITDNTYRGVSFGPSRNQYYKLYCERKNLEALKSCPRSIPQKREELAQWQVGDWGYYQGYLGFAILAGVGMSQPPLNVLPKINVERGWQFYIERKSADEFYLELRPTQVRTLSVIGGVTPVAGVESYFYQEWARGKAFLLSLSRHAPLIDQVLARDVSVLEVSQLAGRVDWYKSHRGFKFYLQTPIFQFFSLQSYYQKTEEKKQWQYIWEEQENRSYRYAHETFSGWRWFNEATAEMNIVEWIQSSPEELRVLWRYQKTNARDGHLSRWFTALPDWQKEFLPQPHVRPLPEGTLQLEVEIKLPLSYFVNTATSESVETLGKKAVKEAQSQLMQWQEAMKALQNPESSIPRYGQKEWWQWESELKQWILASSQARFTLKGQQIKQRQWDMKAQRWVNDHDETLP